MSLKNKTYNILKGKFLVVDASKNWTFIVFLTSMALIMIASSHSIDKKAQKMTRFSKQRKELKAKYIATKSKLMKLQLQTSLIKKVKSMGLVVAENPPIKLEIKKVKQ